MHWARVAVDPPCKVRLIQVGAAELAFGLTSCWAEPMLKTHSAPNPIISFYILYHSLIFDCAYL